ncbi:MAG: hypothetical protein HN548_01215 [Opitutae bacterium]|jgi:hypothetical protein|nr:hypothetical protein [Opitutae bacterium]
MIVKKRGSILVFILALIVLLSVLCMRLMQETVQELRHVSQFHRRDDLRMHAYSALDVAVGALNEFMMLEKTLYAPSQGWGDPLSYAEITPLDSRVQWSISLIDESGKVPISAISEKDLVSLFAIMRAEEDSLVNEDDGQLFYDTLMDWQDADEEERDEGAEDGFYEDLEIPYFTPGKKIENFEEFRMVKGFAYDADEPEESGLFYSENGSETIHMKNFRDSFSFFHNGPVNINTASSYLVKFLCGDDDGLYDEILSGPSGSSGDPFFKSMNDPKLAQMRNNRSISTSTTATVFRVLITVNKGKANFQLHAILASGKAMQPSQQGGKGKVQKPRSQQNSKIRYPFRVLSIRENENLVD